MPEGHPEIPRNADAAPSSATLREKLARQLDEPTAGPLDPPPIPDHELLRCIGAGACGEVWLARTALGTLRAVKIVYRARFKEDRPYEREFEGILKYEPVSRTHEGLVQVLHVGRDDAAGCFYYVMELADAEPEEATPETPAPTAPSAASYRPRTLRSELSRRQRLPPIEAAQLTLRLTQALAHLHDQGLVHRDIKPGNIIFASGQPKLADIGLVTDVGSSCSFVGTEGFIAPEGPGTPQADLYALGKLLYELATGRDRLDFPQLPPRVRQMPEGEALLELNEVVTRACAPKPANRYSTATELQAELDLFLAGRSLRRARHLERHLERLKTVAVGAGVLLAMTVVALWFSKREARDALERANAESALRRRAEAAERESQSQLYSALLEQARATVRSGELGQRVRALDAIRRAAAISNRFELRREALSALSLPDLRFERELTVGPEFTVKWLAPDFERIALCRGSGPMEIRAVSDQRLLATLPASTNFICYGATWSRDGRYLALKRDYPAIPARGDLEVWKVDEPRRVLLIRDVRFNVRAFHPHRPQLLTAGADGWIIAWDLEAGKELARGKFEAAPESLIHSPEGNRVAAAYKRTDGWGVSIHKSADGSLLMSQVLTSSISALGWHPDGRWVAITDFDGGVHLLDSHSGGMHTLGRHKAEAVNVMFSPDGNYLLTGGWERELICWDVRTMQRAMTIGRDSYIAQFRADGRACALLTLAGVQLHTFEPPTAHQKFAEDLGPRLRHAAFSPDGRWLAASADKRVGIWDLTANAPGVLTEAGADTQLFWSREKGELFGSSRYEDCFRWHLQSTTNPSAPPVLQRLKLSRPDGFVSLNLVSNQIVWTGDGGSQLTGVKDAAEDAHWVNTSRGITGVSPDNRWLGMYQPYSTVLHIYRLPELTPVTRLTNQVRIEGFSFSPLLDEVGVASRGQLEFWSTTTWERTRDATNFIGIPDIGMLFAPDGRTVWLATDFRTAGLYDARTFEPILLLPNGRLPLALSADGHQLAVSVDAQRLEVWNFAAMRQHFRELGLDWAVR